MRHILIAYTIILVLGYLDYITGYEVRLGSFYLLTMALAAWTMPRNAVIIFALATVGVWTSASLLSSPHHFKKWLIYWNMANQLASLALTAVSVRMVRRTLDEQQRLIRELRRVSLDARQLREIIPVCRICDQLRTDEAYQTSLNEFLVEARETCLGPLGGVCPSCLQARAEHIASIPVPEYFQAATP